MVAHVTIGGGARIRPGAPRVSGRLVALPAVLANPCPAPSRQLRVAHHGHPIRRGGWATTTLAHYAHWIPRGDKGWVDKLAARRAAEAEKFGTKSWHQSGSASEGDLEVSDLAGAGGGSRTRDLLITKEAQHFCSFHRVRPNA